MSTGLEVVTHDIKTHIDPRLIGMAAAYGLEVSVDEEAMAQALPRLTLPGTEPGKLEFNAELRREAVFKDVYWLQRTIDEDERHGANLTIYYSQRDVRRQRDHQDVVLPAIKEALNIDNEALRRVVRKYEDRRQNAAGVKTMASIGLPVAAAVFGAH